jgi:endonuclease III
MNDQSSDRVATGMVSAQDLTKKNPKRYQRCVDTFVPRIFNRIQSLRHSFTRQNVREWQLTILKKLTSEKIELCSKRTFVRIPHP